MFINEMDQQTKDYQKMKRQVAKDNGKTKYPKKKKVVKK